MTFAELLEKINDVTPELKSLILEAYQVGYKDALETMSLLVNKAYLDFSPIDRSGLMMQVVDYEAVKIADKV